MRNGYILYIKLSYQEERGLSEAMSPLHTSHAFDHLHRLAGYCQAVDAFLADVEERLEFILDVHDQCNAACTGFTGGMLMRSATFSRSVRDSLVWFLSRSRKARRWSINVNERVKIRINLYFNLASQTDNRTNLKIANLTTKISAETHRDSSSMIT